MSILVIENDPDQLELMEQLLGVHGLKLDSAASLVEARDVLEGRSYDVVITDYDLGDGFSTELFDAGLLEPSRTIVLTGHGHPNVPAEVVVLRKPVALERFLDQLGAVLASPLSSQPTAHNVQAPAEPEPEPEPAPIEAILYYAGQTPSGAAARRNLSELLETLDQGRRVDVEHIDIAQTPERIDPADAVVFTPTLVRRRPLPRVWVVGDLADREVVRAVFEG